MTAEYYLALKQEIIYLGYQDEIDWQTELQPVTDPIIFRNEAIWVILNSGMKAQIARLIHTRIWQAINDKRNISEVFGHKGKVAAIKKILCEYNSMFDGYLRSINKIEYLKTIPFIGEITCYHLAKNLGHDVVKPDRHLVRIANHYKFPNCNEMCLQLSKQTGDKVSVVDIVLWRSANLGLV